MKIGGGFEKLLKKDAFITRIVSMVFDKAHCVSQWETFRPEYWEILRLRYQLTHVLFIFTSGTFLSAILTDIKTMFGIFADNCVMIHHSNDHLNICIGVRKIKHLLNTYKDLAFLVLDGWKDEDLLSPKFVIFFDSIVNAVHAAKSLIRRLPFKFRHKIV